MNSNIKALQKKLSEKCKTDQHKQNLEKCMQKFKDTFQNNLKGPLEEFNVSLCFYFMYHQNISAPISAIKRETPLKYWIQNDKRRKWNEKVGFGNSPLISCTVWLENLKEIYVFVIYCVKKYSLSEASPHIVFRLQFPSCSRLHLMFYSQRMRCTEIILKIPQIILMKKLRNWKTITEK